MSGVLFGLSLLAFILGALATALPGKQFSTKAAFTLAALGGLLAVGTGLAAIYGAPFNGVVDLG
jgi:hypothetical protein